MLTEFIRKLFRRMIFWSLLNVLCFYSSFIYADDANTESQIRKLDKTVSNNDSTKLKPKEEPPRIGNFALPLSQQLGPLVSFGQNIIKKNQTQIFFFANDTVGVDRYEVDVIPAFLYAFTDSSSIYFVVPIGVSLKNKNNYSSGLQDAAMQFEYAFYSKSTSEFVDSATFVTNMTFPTGSPDKQPPTGFGSPSFFLGATYSRTYVDWYGFTSHGVILTTSADDTKFGNQFFYQFGLARNILTIDSKWIFALMAEFDGTYFEKNLMHGMIDPNSGGNIALITPSLWISSKKLIFQGGVGFPLYQHWNGNQTNTKYLLITSLGWTF